MSQSKCNKITIRNRPGTEGHVSKGGNMQVLLDGKPIGGAYFVKFEVHAKKVAKVTIEMYAEVELEADFELENTEKESKDLVDLRGRPVNLYGLQSLFPIGAAYKKN